MQSWTEPPEELRQPTLLAGGVPCPPFSAAGKGLGPEDDRDMFPAMIRLAGQLEPAAIMIENVRGLMSSRFDSYRAEHPKFTDERKEYSHIPSPDAH